MLPSARYALVDSAGDHVLPKGAVTFSVAAATSRRPRAPVPRAARASAPRSPSGFGHMLCQRGRTGASDFDLNAQCIHVTCASESTFGARNLSLLGPMLLHTVPLRPGRPETGQSEATKAARHGRCEGHRTQLGGRRASDRRVRRDHEYDGSASERRGRRPSAWCSSSSGCHRGATVAEHGVAGPVLPARAVEN